MTDTRALAALGAQFRRYRLDAGLTQIEVAEGIDRSRASVANFEAGRQDLPLSRLLAMAGMVGLRVTFEPATLRRTA